jgi:isoquinoline 1-oxidoreductase
MMFGAAVRPEGFNATLAMIDTTGVEKFPGAKVIHDGDFFGVIAPDAFTAQRAVAAIEARWTVPPQPSNEGLFEYLKNNPEPGGESEPQHVAGSVADAIASADIKLEDRYTVEYIAHQPLEPPAPVA